MPQTIAPTSLARSLLLPRRARGLQRLALSALLLLLAVNPPPVHADVTILLEQPVNFLGHLIASGHTALWLDSICADGYIHLRPCMAGEPGIILSRYSGAAGYDWLAVPPNAYFFAATSLTPDSPPRTRAGLAQLRRVYLEQHPDPLNEHLDPSLWTAMLGASYRRTILAIHLRTTPQQDQRLLHWLSTRPNSSHFNLFWNNCADFSAQLLDVLFPGSVHRNIIFDAGIMNPEQVASQLTRYARRHPSLDMTISVLPQLPGPIPRSGKMYGTTEAFIKTKPWLLPLTVLNPLEFSIVIASGLCDHRFDVQQHIKTAPRLALPLTVASAGDAGE